MTVFPPRPRANVLRLDSHCYVSGAIPNRHKMNHTSSLMLQLLHLKICNSSSLCSVWSQFTTDRVLSVYITKFSIQFNLLSTISEPLQNLDTLAGKCSLIINLIIGTMTNNIKSGIKEQSNVYQLIYIGYTFDVHHQMIYIGMFFDCTLSVLRRDSNDQNLDNRQHRC